MSAAPVLAAGFRCLGTASARATKSPRSVAVGPHRARARRRAPHPSPARRRAQQKQVDRLVTIARELLEEDRS